MRIDKFAAAALLGLSVLGLTGCATGFPAEVSRYNAMPAPPGQSFFIMPANPRDAGGLQFSRYAGLVAQGLQAQGYAQAPSLQAATMVVTVGYGVDEGEQKVVRDPFARGYGYDPFYGGYDPFYRGYRDPFYRGYGGYYGRPYYSRYRYYGPRSPFYYGWDDAYMGYGGMDGPYGHAQVYTVYESFLDMDIRRKADNAALFEGQAQARSRTDNLGVLIPNLVEAMFTGFPGRSGETVKITVPAAK